MTWWAPRALSFASMMRDGLQPGQANRRASSQRRGDPGMAVPCRPQRNEQVAAFDGGESVAARKLPGDRRIARRRSA